MQDKDVPEGVASTWLSAFWLTFTFSRLIAALSVPPDTDHFVVMGLAVSCILFSLGFVFSRTATSTFALVVTAGLILGPIVPILIAFPVGHVVLTLQGRSIGLFLYWQNRLGHLSFSGRIRREKIQRSKSVFGHAGCACALAMLCLTLNLFEA